MCGISGFFGNNLILDQELQNLASNMASAIKHRGPDENYSQSSDSLGSFQMSRLSIVNLDSNLYPISSRSGWKLFFNGEIYNYKELEQEIIHIDKKFFCKSEGDVLLKGYEVWGHSFWRKLEGIFSIVLWNETTNEVILVRDFLGIKPLYLINCKDIILFTSEITSFIAVRHQLKKLFKLDISLNFENLGIFKYFMFNTLDQFTMYNHVKELSPGTYLHYRHDRFTTTRYWNPESFWKSTFYANLGGTGIQQAINLELTASIQRQIPKEVPFAVALSDGIDSNFLYNKIKALIEGVPNSLTLTFSGDKRSESPNVGGNERSLNRHNELIIETEDLYKNLDNYIHLYQDLTTLDGGLLTNHLLSALARDLGYKVLIFGEGADELFGGYTWFGLGNKLFSILPQSATSRLHAFALSRKMPFDNKYFRYPFDKTVKNRSAFERVRDFELFVQLKNHLLQKVDRATMSVGIEGRVPYLSKSLVEIILSSPAESFQGKLKFGFLPDPSRTKPTLRSIYANEFGTEMATKPKFGFQLPLDTMVSYAKTFLLDHLCLDDPITQAMFNEIDFKKTRLDLESNKKLKKYHEWLLWRFIIIKKVEIHFGF